MFARSLTSILKNSSLLREEAYISGKWCTADSGQRFEVTNPATGEVIAHVADLGVAEFKAAFETAQVAQKEWAEATGKERAGVLRRLFELVMANQEDLAKILTAEVGKPLAEARGEIAYGASYIEWFGEEAKRIYGDTIPGYQRDKRLLGTEATRRSSSSNCVLELPFGDGRPEVCSSPCRRVLHCL